MLRQHLEYQIRNSPIRRFPFDHMLVENVLPSDLYRELLRLLPSFEMYDRPERPGETRRDLASIERERTAFSLSDPSLDRLGSEAATLLREIRDAFLDHRFTAALLEVFSESLRNTRGAVPHIDTCFSRTMIIRDFAGYAIGPHTDVALRVFSAILYLARDASTPELGTAIYSPRDPNFADPVGRHLARDDFTLVTIAPYLPNTMFLFPRANNSFHGVEEVAKCRHFRDILLFDVRLSEDPSI